MLQYKLFENCHMLHSTSGMTKIFVFAFVLRLFCFLKLLKHGDEQTVLTHQHVVLMIVVEVSNLRSQ